MLTKTCRESDRLRKLAIDLDLNDIAERAVNGRTRDKVAVDGRSWTRKASK